MHRCRTERPLQKSMGLPSSNTARQANEALQHLVGTPVLDSQDDEPADD